MILDCCSLFYGFILVVESTPQCRQSYQGRTLQFSQSLADHGHAFLQANLVLMLLCES